MNKKLFIYCCGGLGREILLLARQINACNKKWDEILFVDDKCDQPKLNNVSVYSFSYVLDNYCKEECEFVVASGEPHIRELIHDRIKENGCRVATLIHPRIYIDESCTISDGCIIFEGASITCDVTMEEGCCIYNGVVVHHDVHIGKHSFVAGNSIICGNVQIGEKVYIGSNAAIRNGKSIGSECIIGMGSIVVKDIPKNKIAYGNPAIEHGTNTKKRVFQ